MRARGGTQAEGRGLQGGFSLLEFSVAIAIMSVLGAAFVAAARVTLTTFGDVRSTAAMQLDGARALKSVEKALRETGPTTISGVTLPAYVVIDVNGVATGNLAGQSHTTPRPIAPVGQPSNGGSREVYFAVPANDATTGVPIEGATCKLVWSSDIASIILGTGSDGTSQLILRKYRPSTSAFVSQKTIAKNVDRFVVDDIRTDPTLQSSVLHIQIYFYATDEAGKPINVLAESFIAMRSKQEP